MCFYHDFDNYPEVYDENESPTGSRTSCDECDRVIEESEWRLEIYTQQYELPQNSEPNEDEDSDEYAIPEGYDPDYGDTSNYTRCLHCHKVLEVIRKVEEEEGCSGYETQPALTQLRETLDLSYDAGAYVDRVKSDHPELIEHLKLLGVTG